MHFEEGKIYHVYNRGNNKEKIYFSSDNYLYFLKKIRTHILPIVDILAYCLMPNHFHFMIHANEKTIQSSKIINGRKQSALSEAFRIVLSSYTRGINKQENRSGSLFQQNTQAKAVFDSFNNYYYVESCFYYIHQNPLKSELVKNLKDWPYSSFLDYAQLRNGTLCNQQLAKQLIQADWEDFSNSMHYYVLKQD